MHVYIRHIAVLLPFSLILSVTPVLHVGSPEVSEYRVSRGVTAPARRALPLKGKV